MACWTFISRDVKVTILTQRNLWKDIFLHYSFTKPFFQCCNITRISFYPLYPFFAFLPFILDFPLSWVFLPSLLSSIHESISLHTLNPCCFLEAFHVCHHADKSNSAYSANPISFLLSPWARESSFPFLSFWRKTVVERLGHLNSELFWSPPYSHTPHLSQGLSTSFFVRFLC